MKSIIELAAEFTANTNLFKERKELFNNYISLNNHEPVRPDTVTALAMKKIDEHKLEARLLMLNSHYDLVKAIQKMFEEA